MKKSKRHIAFLLFLTVALLITACGGKPKGASEGGEAGQDQGLPQTDRVVIGVSGGDWEKNIRAAALDKFAQETGIKVEIVTGTDAEWFNKIKAANGKNPSYDILVLQPDTILRLMSADLLQPLDTEHVPNLADLYPSVNERFTKDGKIYAAGFSMGQLGIAYREDLVPVKPTKWTDLWRPEYKGHVAVSSPTYSAGLQFFSGLIHALGGQEKNEEDVNRAFEKLAELKDNVVAFPDNGGTVQTLLERGDAWVVPFWDGRVFAMKKAGINVGFAYPEDGPVAAMASWAIMKGSPNLANAYKLLNYLCSPEVQKAFSDLSLYGMTNKKVQYSEELLKQVQVGEEFYSKLKWVDYETVTPKLAEWTNRWTQIMGG